MTSNTATIDFLEKCVFNPYYLGDGTPICINWGTIIGIVGIVSTILILLSVIIKYSHIEEVKK